MLLTICLVFAFQAMVPLADDDQLFGGRFRQKGRITESNSTPDSLRNILTAPDPSAAEEAIFKFFSPELNTVFKNCAVNEQVLFMKLIHSNGIDTRLFMSRTKDMN